jgi:hypothetical protein
MAIEILKNGNVAIYVGENVTVVMAEQDLPKLPRTKTSIKLINTDKKVGNDD